MDNRGRHAGEYYDLRQWQQDDTVLEEWKCAHLGEDWTYGEDDRGPFLTHKNMPGKWRTMPKTTSNRESRREVGIRTPLVILRDYQNTLDDLYDTEG